MSAQVKLVPSRTLEGKQVFILLVGARMFGSYATVAEAKAFLRKKFGSRFHEGTASVRNPSTSWKTVSAFISSKGGNPREFETAYHTSVSALMRALSAAGIGYGMEYIREPLKAPYSNGLAYLNMGDPYAKTLLYVGSEPRGKYIVGNWGDIVEKYEKRKRNISMGITRGTGRTRKFYPIRASADYDPSLLSGSEGKRARSEKRSAAKKRSGLKAKGKKAIKTKSTVKTKLATKRRKAKKAVGLFGARALKKALPTSRRNPKRWKIFDIAHQMTLGFIEAETERSALLKASKKFAHYDKRFTRAIEVESAQAPKGKLPNPKGKAKRPIPAAFKAAAQRAKAMTPAQRSAWAKKMQAARKAKAKLKNR